MSDCISDKMITEIINCCKQYKCPRDIIQQCLLPIIYINSCPEHINIWNYAAQIGSLELIILLHQNNIKAHKDVMNRAAEYGHLHIIIWFYNNKIKVCTSDTVLFAAQNGHLHILQWLYINKPKDCCEYLHLSTWLIMNRKIDWARMCGKSYVSQWLQINDFNM